MEFFKAYSFKEVLRFSEHPCVMR